MRATMCYQSERLERTTAQAFRGTEREYEIKTNKATRKPYLPRILPKVLESPNL
jgi:hypothetical protein